MALNYTGACPVHRDGIVEYGCEVRALRHGVLLHVIDVHCSGMLHVAVTECWSSTA